MPPFIIIADEKGNFVESEPAGMDPNWPRETGERRKNMTRVARGGNIMGSGPDTVPVSKPMLWAGRIMSGVVALMLLFSGVMKLAKPAAVVEEFVRLGYPDRLALGIGVLEIACTVLYVIPRTSVLGAVLLTGYLGGATTTHLRIGDAFFIPVILGVLVWGGLYLREPRLRALLPLRR
jgi:hypothetical protein